MNLVISYYSPVEYYGGTLIKVPIYTEKQKRVISDLFINKGYDLEYRANEIDSYKYIFKKSYRTVEITNEHVFIFPKLKQEDSVQISKDLYKISALKEHVYFETSMEDFYNSKNALLVGNYRSASSSLYYCLHKAITSFLYTYLNDIDSDVHDIGEIEVEHFTERKLFNNPNDLITKLNALDKDNVIENISFLKGNSPQRYNPFNILGLFSEKIGYSEELNLVADHFLNLLHDYLQSEHLAYNYDRKLKEKLLKWIDVYKVSDEINKNVIFLNCIAARLYWLRQAADYHFDFKILINPKEFILIYQAIEHIFNRLQFMNKFGSVINSFDIPPIINILKLISEDKNKSFIEYLGIISPNDFPWEIKTKSIASYSLLIIASEFKASDLFQSFISKPEFVCVFDELYYNDSNPIYCLKYMNYIITFNDYGQMKIDVISDDNSFTEISYLLSHSKVIEKKILKVVLENYHCKVIVSEPNLIYGKKQIGDIDKITKHLFDLNSVIVEYFKDVYNYIVSNVQLEIVEVINELTCVKYILRKGNVVIRIIMVPFKECCNSVDSYRFNGASLTAEEISRIMDVDGVIALYTKIFVINPKAEEYFKLYSRIIRSVQMNNEIFYKHSGKMHFLDEVVTVEENEFKNKNYNHIINNNEFIDGISILINNDIHDNIMTGDECDYKYLRGLIDELLKWGCTTKLYLLATKGMLYFNEGNIEKGIYYYLEAIKLKPKHDDLVQKYYLEYGKALFKSGDVELAKKMWEHGLEIVSSRFTNEITKVMEKINNNLE